MERKKGDNMQQPESGQKVPKEKRPGNRTQTESKKPETKQRAINEEQPSSPRKPPKKQEEVMAAKTASEVAIPTRKPVEKQEKVRGGKPTNEGTGPKKQPKNPKQVISEKTDSDANVIPPKKLQKKPQDITESKVNQQPSRSIDGKGGKPIRVREDDSNQNKKMNKIRQTKEGENANLSQEPSLQTKNKDKESGEDALLGISPSVYEDITGQDGMETKRVPPKYSPETFTGVNELPAMTLLIIIILWLPRFFVPWMTDWHEYNVFILMNPDLFEQHVDELFKHDMILLFVKCVVGIVCAIIADYANMRYYVYLTLLCLFIFCPVAGGVVDVVLRSRTFDQHYYKNWFWCIIMMRWAMAIPFIITPVQFACIFLEKNDMSRKAHYNWTGIFFFFEFVNAYVSFWVIPAKCPTKDWIQIAVWAGIGMLMFIVIFFTFIIFLLIKETRATFMTCLKICGKRLTDKLEETSKTIQTKNTSKVTPNIRKACMKLLFFVLLLMPLVYMSFVFSVLDRFLPDDDWDKHKSLSATSMFLLGKIIGVVVTVIAMFLIRKFGKISRIGKMGKFVQKIARFRFFSMDVMVLGWPHLLNILALFVLIGRFETLTKGVAIRRNHELFGPIPNPQKTVVLFFNLMLSNRTVCVGSEHFRSVKIRPFRYAAVEIFDLGRTRSVNVTITPEPGSTPLVSTSFTMNHIDKFRWIAYTISIFNDAMKYVKHKTGPNNYYAKPRVVHLDDNSVNLVIRPHDRPFIIIPNNYNDVRGKYKYWIKYPNGYENNGPFGLEVLGESAPNLHFFPRDPYDERAVDCCYFNISISDSNASKPDDNIPRYTFRVNSVHRWPLYYLVNYLHTPIEPGKNYTARELPVWFKLFLVAEIARVDDQAHLPEKSEMQQDWAIKLGLSLAGMAAGGVYVGVIYVFWMDLPFPKYPATTMALFWAFWAGAAEPARLKLIEIDPPTKTIVMSLPAKLLTAHIPFTALHFAAAIFFYHPKFNFRERPE